MTSTPDTKALARLHAECFVKPRPWTAQEFREILLGSGVFLASDAGGFVIGRAIADEAELLTIAVSPDLRRRGLGRDLLSAYEDGARARGAARSFLEVAADNAAAIGLYLSHGYARFGLRRGYYVATDGGATDALILEKNLQ